MLVIGLIVEAAAGVVVAGRVAERDVARQAQGARNFELHLQGELGLAFGRVVELVALEPIPARQRCESVAGQAEVLERLGFGKTIFLVATKSGNSDTVYTSYTGIANVPTIKAGSTAAKVNAYVKSGSTATVVYIDATDATTTTPPRPLRLAGRLNDKVARMGDA